MTSVNVRTVRTLCPYCGCGCGIVVQSINSFLSVIPDKGSPVNRGKLCIKGRYIPQLIDALKDRPKKPVMRRGGKFVEVDWRKAAEILAEELKKCYTGFVSSAKCTNEENYLMQKLCRLLGTNNVDHCARLCHSPTVSALSRSLGSGAMTNPIDDIAMASCVFIIGSNTFEQHPLVATRVLEARDSGASIVVADPRRNVTAKNADLHLQLYPGTNVALLNAMTKVIIDEELYDESFLRERVSNFEEFLSQFEGVNLEELSEICGVGKEDIERAAELISGKTAFVYCMGLTQFTSGTDGVLCLANLALLTGNLGKRGCGIFPLRGQNNVQGACDMGALPEFFPGYARVCEDNARKFGELWKAEISGEAGLTLPEMFSSREIEAMYIMGENPVVSEANCRKVEKKLSSLEFLAVQDVFFTETAEFADLFIPVASWAEKDGTFTNTERRVQRIRKFLNSDYPSDLEFISMVAKALGFNFPSTPSEVFSEIEKVVKQYRGLGDKIDSGKAFWGGEILYSQRFSTPDGKARLFRVDYRPQAEVPDDEYPLLLTTGRVAFHFHTGTMSRRCHSLAEEVNSTFVEMCEADAKRVRVRNGDNVIVKTRRGEIKARVKIGEIKEGVIFIPFHFSESPANALTNDSLDPQSRIPELKVCAARVEKCGEAE